VRIEQVTIIVDDYDNFYKDSHGRTEPFVVSES
jgi:hypothetical protein